MTRMALAAAAVVALACVVQARQPRMRDALRELREARQELKQASSAKDAHKNRALQHIENAISQVQQGIDAGEDDD
jgi:DNA integrity scanning protein DisA with diadenylate cyclase activity